MWLCLIILLIAFAIAFIVGWKFAGKDIIIRDLREENQSLHNKIEKWTNELNDARNTISKWNREYYDDLKNFKKLIKLYGKEIDYIPVYYTIAKKTENGIIDIREDYVIPEIHICYYEGWDEEEYKAMKGEDND